MEDTIQQLPKEIYATFSGMIDQGAVQRVFSVFPIAVNGGVKKVHLLIHSSGGFVSDGIALYNYLTNLPLDFVTYNCGSIQSVSVLLYLVGEVRKCSGNATFLIHKTRFSFQDAATAFDLRVNADSAELSDKNSDAILRKYITTMPDDKWAIRERSDLTISAQEAKEFGLVHDISDFCPPEGTQLYNI